MAADAEYDTRNNTKKMDIHYEWSDHLIERDKTILIQIYKSK